MASRGLRVHESQRGNALLRYLRSSRFKVVFVQSSHDFEPGTYFGVLYLSLKFHLMHPGYVYKRIEALKAEKSLRHTVVLVLMDVEVASSSSITAFGKLQVECLSFGIDVLASSSAQESARYIETMHAEEKEERNGSGAGARIDMKDRFRNYEHLLRQQKIKLEKSEIEYDKDSEYVRKTLFLSGVPRMTTRDANVLIPAHATLREAVEKVSGGQAATRGIGKIKQTSFKDFMNHPFK